MLATASAVVTAPGSYRAAAHTGARLGALSGAAQQLLSMLSTVVLARLLTPDAFGIVAAASVVVGALRLVSQFGLSATLIRSRQLQPRETSTVFWTAAVLGALIAGASILGSNPLARSVGVPDAAPYLSILGVAGALGLIAAVPRALLQRDLRLRLMYTLDAAQMTIYSIVPVILAFRGAGAWSLVVGQLVSQLVGIGLFLFASRWRPQLTFSWQFLRSQASFNVYMLGDSGMQYVVKNADFWLVGHLLGSAQLGIYYVAYVIPNILRQRLTSVSLDVLLPILSKFPADKRRVRSAYTSSLRIHALVGIPMMAGVSVLSHSILEVFFGDKWDAASGPLRIIAIAAMFDFLSATGSAMFVARGQPNRVLAIMSVRLVVFAVAMTFVAQNPSLTLVAWAVFASALAALLVNQVIVQREIQLAASVVLRTILPIVLAAALMVATIISASMTAISRIPTGVELFLLVLTGVLSFTFFTYVISPAKARVLFAEMASLSGLATLRRPTRPFTKKPDH